jgi:hypothetical protein
MDYAIFAIHFHEDLAMGSPNRNAPQSKASPFESSAGSAVNDLLADDDRAADNGPSGGNI